MHLRRVTTAVVLLCIAAAAFQSPVFASGSRRARRVKRIVGGVQAALPPPDDPVVFVRLYGRNARVEGRRDAANGVYSFLGLRFAEPPLGADRFVRPRFRHLRGDINATAFGPPCPQPAAEDGRTTDQVVGSEDCLRLNVFTPRLPDDSSAGLPVLVFIHGGGFRYGSANQYGPDPLTSKSIIFVPIQYRLGTLGLIGDGSAEFAGNAALFDMAAAVRWVHEYISFFGGDPAQVSVIGHGSGATSAVQLSMSDAIDDGMIAGVVAMSGTPMTKYATDEQPAQSVRQVAELNGCGALVGREAELLRCLRNVSVDDLVRRDSRVQVERLQGARVMRSMTGMAGFGPAVGRMFDDRGLPSLIDGRPEEKLQSGRFRRVPLLTGVTRDETAGCLAVKEIRSVFKTATDFLDKFIETLDLGKLLNLGSGTDSQQMRQNKVDLLGVGKVVSLNDYLRVPQQQNPLQILAKLTEATTDALFNLPAVLSAQAWAKVAPSFMYSFEHVGHQAKGRHFLGGLPLVAQVTKPDDDDSGGDEGGKRADRVAHGDELGYLFDARDLFGKSLGQELSNETDARVRGAFTDLIRNFMLSIVQPNATTTTTGFATPTANMKPLSPSFSLFGDIKPSPTNTAFIRIGARPSQSQSSSAAGAEVAHDFRYCQLSVWGAKLRPDRAESCAFLIDELAALNTLTSNLTDVLGLSGNGKGLLGGLTGSPTKQKKRTAGGGLLGLGGLL